MSSNEYLQYDNPFEDAHFDKPHPLGGRFSNEQSDSSDIEMIPQQGERHQESDLARPSSTGNLLHVGGDSPNGERKKATLDYNHRRMRTTTAAVSSPSLYHSADHSTVKMPSDVQARLNSRAHTSVTENHARSKSPNPFRRKVRFIVMTLECMATLKASNDFFRESHLKKKDSRVISRVG